MSHKQNYTAGYVTMPIEEYNRLIERANFIYYALRVHKAWDNTLDIEIDKELIYPVAMKLFRDSLHADNFEAIPFDDFYTPSIHIAKKPTEENMPE